MKSMKIINDNNYVSRALDWAVDPRLHKIFTDILASIDKVHRDGRLPQINVDLVSKRELSGYVAKIERSKLGTPFRLCFSRNCIDEPHHMVHEIGHFIDLSGVPKEPGDPIYQSEKEASGPFSHWWKAVTGSTAFHFWKKGGHSYYCSPKELFARSYSQFIAKKSKNELLIRLIRNDYRPNFPYQWHPSDFQPIIEAMEADFTALGWMP